MTILAIESSCDETSASVLCDGVVLSNVIHSQIIHSKFGGVIPELASREHIQKIAGVVKNGLEQAGKNMSEIDAIAVTTSPGLGGALLVGSSFAKGLALKYDLPIVPVNHIEGHLYSAHLENPSLPFPALVLVVSGGHTTLYLAEDYSHYRILGSTRDDSAGEAFDKTAKLLGLGYPGGPMIDQLSAQGRLGAFVFPQALRGYDGYDFSFSGLKTSVRTFVQKNFKLGVPEELIPDMCLAIQSAIVGSLMARFTKAVDEFQPLSIAIAGGVSANSMLRNRITELSIQRNLPAGIPRMSYCLDNAAMIGFVAEKKLQSGSSNDFRSLSFKVNTSALRDHRHAGR